MCSRDLLTRRRENVTPRGTTAKFLGVLFSFGTFRRRRRDVLIGRRGYAPLRRLGNVPLRRRWVSFETFLRCHGDVLMGRRWYVLLRRRGDVPLRRLGDVPFRRRLVFHLGRTCDVTRTCRETLLQRRHDVFEE